MPFVSSSMKIGFETGFAELKEMFMRGNVDLWWRRLLKVEYREAFRLSGPRPCPGWTWTDDEGGIVGIARLLPE